MPSNEFNEHPKNLRFGHAIAKPSPSIDQHQQAELDRLAGMAPSKTVAISLAQLTSLLLDATQANRTWLHDFADDVVRVDQDLFDVLLAYQEMCQSGPIRRAA